MKPVDTSFLEKQIEALKAYMARQEYADDFYYTKGTYKQDSQELRQLEKQLKDIKEGL